MNKHLVALLINEPFWGRMSRLMTKVPTPHLPTAGVLVTEGNIILKYNPEFIARLEEEGPMKVIGLLKHEIMHLVLGHCTTRVLDHHKIGNIAMDLAINSIIPSKELPACGIWPGKKELLESADPIHQLMGNFPVGKSAEWYYTRLMADPNVQEAMTKDDGLGLFGEGMDSHDEWSLDGEGMGATGELVQGAIKAALSEAVKKCDIAGTWGSIPEELRGTLRTMVSNQVDWRKVLRQWVGMTRRGNRASTWRRINKRCPGAITGSRRGYTCSLVTYVDQSGSVNDAAQTLLFGELNSLAKTRTIDLYTFDTAVDEASKITVSNAKQVTPFRTRNGGTDFEAPMNHVLAHKKMYDGMIIMTDGMAPDPGPPIRGIRRLWVITPGCTLNFKPHAGDQVITLLA